MEAEFEQAAALRIRAEGEVASFQKQCKVHEDELLETIESAEAVFDNVLQTGDAEAYRFDDGSYLYMRQARSTKKINEARIGEAVNAIRYKQMQEAMRALTDAGKPNDPVAVLCQCIVDNLHTECVTVKHKPTMARSWPKDLDSAIVPQPAPADLAETAVEYNRTKAHLRDVRKHKRRGKEQLDVVTAQTAPVIEAYLEANDVAGKRVDVVPEGSAAAAAAATADDGVAFDLPSVPQIVSVPERRSAKRPKIDKTPVTIVAPPDAEPRSLVVQRKEYPAKGKPPALDAFQEVIPEAVAPLLDEEPQLKKWATQTGKQRVVDALCVVYRRLFESNKREARSKIAVSKVKQ